MAWKINSKLVPIKAHYFFFMAAAGAILPFLPVLAKSLGVSAAALGLITSLLPVAVLISKPTFGALSDLFPRHRHAIFMSAVIGQAIALAALGFIPRVGRQAGVELSNGTDFSIETTLEGVPEPTEAEYNLYLTMNFWTFVILMSVGNVCFNVANSLSDAICFEMLGEGKELNYGNQRVWGCVGWGGSALLSGASMAWWGEGDFNSMGLAPACFLTLGFGTLDALSCCWLELPERKASGSMLADLKRLALRRSAILFLAFAALVGVLDGFLIYYLLWYLEDLAGAQSTNLKLLEGLVVASQTLGGEVIFFPLSGWFLKRLGHSHCLSLVFCSFALRLALLSMVLDPWYIIPIELLLQGPTYALGYSTIVAYASAVSPPGTAATVQGIAAGVDDSLGYSIGSLMGGQLYRSLGGKGAFQSMSVLAIICCLSHLGLQELLMVYKRRHTFKLHQQPAALSEVVELKLAEDTKCINRCTVSAA